MGATTLLAGNPGLEHARRDVEQVAELDRLGEVAVEDVALVLDHDATVVALAETLDHLHLRLHLLGAPEDTEVVEHRLAQLVTNRPRALAFGVREQSPDPGLRVGPRGLTGAVGLRGTERVLRGCLS